MNDELELCRWKRKLFFKTKNLHLDQVPLTAKILLISGIFVSTLTFSVGLRSFFLAFLVGLVESVFLTFSEGLESVFLTFSEGLELLFLTFSDDLVSFFLTFSDGLGHFWLVLEAAGLRLVLPESGTCLRCFSVLHTSHTHMQLSNITHEDMPQTATSETASATWNASAYSSTLAEALI